MVAGPVLPSFLWLSDIPCVDGPRFYPSPSDGHLGRSHLPAIVRDAAGKGGDTDLSEPLFQFFWVDT